MGGNVFATFWKVKGTTHCHQEQAKVALACSANRKCLNHCQIKAFSKPRSVAMPLLWVYQRFSGDSINAEEYGHHQHSRSGGWK